MFEWRRIVIAVYFIFFGLGRDPDNILKESHVFGGEHELHLFFKFSWLMLTLNAFLIAQEQEKA